MRFFFLFVFFSICLDVFAQFRTPLHGKITLNGAVLEHAHIINLASNKTTITNTKGVFSIPVDKGDILHITHLSAREQYYSIMQADLDEPFLAVALKENFNTLNEVTIVEDNRITVQSVGIIQGKKIIPTPNERRYQAESKVELRDFVSFDLRNPGLKIPLVPFLNAINGRTKQLKKHLATDKEITDYELLYVYHSEFLAERFELDDQAIQQFLDSLIGIEETRVMAREDELDKTHIWLVKHYQMYKESSNE